MTGGDGYITKGPNGTYSFDLSQLPGLLLTAGQSYYWGVMAEVDGQLIKKSAEFQTAAVHKDAPFNGVTIITPGLELFDGTTPQQYDDLGADVAQASGGGVVLDYDPTKGGWVDASNPSEDGVDAAMADKGKALVLVFDSAQQSEIDDSGYAEAAGDSLFAALVGLDQSLTGGVFLSNIHFIGEDRGAVVNDETIQRLGEYFPGLLVQMTTLNPSDLPENSQNATVERVLQGLDDLKQQVENENDTEQRQSELAVIDSEISGLETVPDPGATLFYGDLDDPTIQVWSNVSFADNYYSSALGAVPALDLQGVPIPGAAINLKLDGRAGFGTAGPGGLAGLSFGPGGEGEGVLDWYAGTVDVALTRFDGEPVDRGLPAGVVGGPALTAALTTEPWYTAQESITSSQFPYGAPTGAREGIGEGWFFSDFGGGSALRPYTPSGAGVTYDNDNTDDPGGKKAATSANALPTVFDGDFESGTLNDSRPILLDNGTIQPVGSNPPIPSGSGDLPGWSFDNGQTSSSDLDAHLDEDPTTGNHYLLLDGTDSTLVHNWLYVPNREELLFDVKADMPNPTGTLTVILHPLGADAQTLAAFDLSTLPSDQFVPLIVEIPSTLAGKVATLEFQLGSGSSAIDLDNVRLGDSGGPSNGGMPETSLFNGDFSLVVAIEDPGDETPGWSEHDALPSPEPPDPSGPLPEPGKPISTDDLKAVSPGNGAPVEEAVTLPPGKVLEHEAVVIPDTDVLRMDVNVSAPGGLLEAFLTTSEGTEQLTAINQATGATEQAVDLDTYENGGDIENAVTGTDTEELLIPAKDVGEVASLAIKIVNAAVVAIANIAFGSKPFQFGNPDGATADPNNPGRYLIDRPQYTLSYNDNLHEPNYSAWSLNKSDIGTLPRAPSSSFKPDTSLPPGFTVIPAGTFPTGYARGHLTPDKDRSNSLQNQLATYWMTNFIPQNSSNNSGAWLVLENFARSLAEDGDQLYIWAGEYGSNGTVPISGTVNQQQVTVNVTVPTDVWKVIMILPAGGGLSSVTAQTPIIVNDFPNAAAPPTVKGQSAWETTPYLITLQQLQQRTGLQFLTSVSAGIRNLLLTKIYTGTDIEDTTAGDIPVGQSDGAVDALPPASPVSSQAIAPSGPVQATQVGLNLTVQGQPSLPPDTRSVFQTSTLTAKYNELPTGDGDRFGTYLANIPLQNTFTLTTPPSVQNVFYRTGPESDWIAVTSHNSNVWTFTVDMGKLPAGDDTLIVVGYDASKIVVSEVNATLVVKSLVQFNLLATIPGDPVGPEPLGDMRFLTNTQVPAPLNVTAVLPDLPLRDAYANQLAIQVGPGLTIPLAGDQPARGTDGVTATFTFDVNPLKQTIYAQVVATNPEKSPAAMSDPIPITVVSLPTWLAPTPAGGSVSFNAGTGLYKIITTIPPQFQYSWSPGPLSFGGLEIIDPNELNMSINVGATLEIDAPVLISQSVVATLQQLVAKLTLLNTPILDDTIAPAQIPNLTYAGTLDPLTFAPNGLKLTYGPVPLPGLKEVDYNLEQTLFEKNIPVFYKGLTGNLNFKMGVQLRFNIPPPTIEGGLQIQVNGNGIDLVQAGTYVSLKAEPTASFTANVDFDAGGGILGVNLINGHVTFGGGIGADLKVNLQVNLGTGPGGVKLDTSNSYAALGLSYILYVNGSLKVFTITVGQFSSQYGPYALGSDPPGFPEIGQPGGPYVLFGNPPANVISSSPLTAPVSQRTGFGRRVSDELVGIPAARPGLRGSGIARLRGHSELHPERIRCDADRRRDTLDVRSGGRRHQSVPRGRR